MQLVCNTAYNIGQSPGNIPYRIWQDLVHSPNYRPYVRWAIPILVGDTYQGRGDRRIVGTSPQMFGYRDDGTQIPNNSESRPFQYRGESQEDDGRSYELDDSKDADKAGALISPRVFRPRRFEAVLGSEVATKDAFHLYDDELTEEQNAARHAVFQATHGVCRPRRAMDIHKPRWHVVGILKPTHTASDRVLYVPVISLYAIEEHDIGLISQENSSRPDTGIRITFRLAQAEEILGRPGLIRMSCQSRPARNSTCRPRRPRAGRGCEKPVKIPMLIRWIKTAILCLSFPKKRGRSPQSS